MGGAAVELGLPALDAASESREALMLHTFFLFCLYEVLGTQVRGRQRSYMHLSLVGILVGLVDDNNNSSAGRSGRGSSKGDCHCGPGCLHGGLLPGSATSTTTDPPRDAVSIPHAGKGGAGSVESILVVFPAAGTSTP